MTTFLPTCLLYPTCLFLDMKKNPTYTFITPYTFTKFCKIFLPTQLLCPTLVLETPEYIAVTSRTSKLQVFKVWQFWDLKPSLPRESQMVPV